MAVVAPVAKTVDNIDVEVSKAQQILQQKYEIFNVSD